VGNTPVFENNFYELLIPWSATTNLCPENKNPKNKKQQNTKEKIFQPPAYLKPQTYLSYHRTTQSLMILWNMLFFYINSKID